MQLVVKARWTIAWLPHVQQGEGNGKAGDVLTARSHAAHPGKVPSDIPPAEEVPRVPKLALLMKAEKVFPCIWRWICITGAFNGKIISEEISF